MRKGIKRLNRVGPWYCAKHYERVKRHGPLATTFRPWQRQKGRDAERKAKLAKLRSGE